MIWTLGLLVTGPEGGGVGLKFHLRLAEGPRDGAVPVVWGDVTSSRDRESAGRRRTGAGPVERSRSGSGSLPTPDHNSVTRSSS